ncbi:baseplate J/gp47 family protein [Paenibacillus selenitireducens]|nr:baseplate J/gp47 family protein [Paenibacillus selenitireducens]
MDHLKYAFGNFLDHIGARSETNRLAASPAQTTVKFTLSAPRPSAITIPVGTRITGSGSQLFFITKGVAEILPGSLTVDVPCECVQAGTVGNGFLPGQLDTLVDLIPFVATVQNITSSAGGAERESDDSYRERIRTAPEGFSTAGPEGAYQHWAKTASPAIVDVGVSSPSDAVVQVVPLLAGGAPPSQDILDAVAGALNDRRIRPLTDKVVVKAPTMKSFSIEFTYWISRERAAEATAIQAAVIQAVNDYMLWQKSKLGRDINPSELIRRVMVAGASRVNVVKPIFTEVNTSEIATASAPNVTYGGMADD